MYRLTKNIYFYIYLILKKWNRVMHEVNLHATVLSGRKVTTHFLGGKMTVFLWECLFRKRSLLHKFSLLTGKIPAWKQNKHQFRRKTSAFFCFKPAGIVSKPFQVRAPSAADHLASVSNGFNTRPRLRRLTTNFQPTPIQLCFVFSMHALAHKAVQQI